MTSPRRSIAGIAALSAAAGLLTTGLSATGSPAAAEELQFRIQVPKHLSVRKAKYYRGCGMDIWVWGAEGPTVAYSKAFLIAPDGSIPPHTVYRLAPGEESGYGVGCPPVIEDLGRWRVRVVAYNRGGKVLGSREDYWYEKFDTVISGFNAAPEPVRKGGTLTVSGRLQRLNDRTTGYVAYPGKSVRIYFKAKGTASWTLKGTTTTSGTGQFRASFKAARDGVWRAYFPGTSRFDKQASSDDYVDVR